MREEILINVTPQETRVAMLENGMLQEIFIEREQNKEITGNIYLGIVVRVLPGMQAAFVDIGLERTAFLHARDLMDRRDDNSQFQQSDPIASISSLVQEGQRIVVQVVKAPLGTKGARLTTQISIPARNMVYLPNGEYVGISQRIKETPLRSALLEKLTNIRQELDARGGFIIRTAGENASREELRSDMVFLLRVWDQVIQRKTSNKAPSMIYSCLPLAMRTVRDLVWQSIEKIRIDSKETFDHVMEFSRELIPDALERIEHYPGERPIFDLYGVEDEIQKALQKRVPLKSGGYLVIDQTEAMTTIDINTGSFVGKRNLEETIFKTNLEAAAALARQLRVRNLGGIIIVDFIDMALEEHCDQVMRTLSRELEKDSTKTQVKDMTSLGLVEVTRKRTTESLEQLLTEPCPCCEGRGIQKTLETVCYEIFREILRAARQFDTKVYLVVASQSVIERLQDDESTGIADLQDFIKRTIQLQVEPTYQQEQYDVVLM
ncbi:MAG: ribonuclease G [Gammaproteobacteria bacterium]|nr:ribonuclease G [Gammaproteobacteria bacterium]